MDVKFKKLSEKAVLPAYAHEGDAGLDLTCTDITTAWNECRQLMIVYHTDIAVEIPEGYVGLVFPRSSIYKKSLSQSNAVGVIDSGYRGEVKVIFRNTTDVAPAIYQVGERFAQLVIVPIPMINVIEAEELSESDRNSDGFGSTGNKPTTEEVSAPTPTDTENASPSEENAE